MAHRTVVILDYGSQYTQLIARRARELGLFSMILPGDAPLDRIRGLDPSAIVLSGGPSSVYDPGAPALPKGLRELCAEKQLAVLAICYGMHLLAHEWGGKVERAQKREYGRMGIVWEKGAGGSSSVFGAKRDRAKAPPEAAQMVSDAKRPQLVWMSHGDEVKILPPGFVPRARTTAGALAAMADDSRRILALQFHPEVTHSEGGLEILRDFFLGFAGLQADWTMGSVLEEQVAKIRAQVGAENHVLCALSGGVDSAVAAALVHRAIGDRLHCVFVDHGLLRFEEQKRVMELFRTQLHLPVRCVDASDRFLSKLAGVVDPERKRKIIGAEFIDVFEDAAKDLQKNLGRMPAFLVQGTLYPDVIESSPAPSSAGGGGFKHSATIKSHHNVGGLPERLPFKLIEPLRELFKDEVRALGKQLGVPADFLERHPFPGPGLAVRIIGDITRERIDVLQRVDEIFISEIRAAGLYREIWQAFAVFLPIKSVGVQGDGRTHDHVVALRAVTSTDGMTADWYPFDPKLLARVSARICNEVRGVNRVTYDISSKPPATIEWE